MSNLRVGDKVVAKSVYYWSDDREMLEAENQEGVIKGHYLGDYLVYIYDIGEFYLLSNDNLERVQP